MPTRCLAVIVLASFLAACAGTDQPSQPAAEPTPAPQAQAPAQAAPRLETEDQKTLYAMGVALGGQLGPLRLDESEVESVMAGFRDVVLNREPAVEMETYGPKIQELARSRAASLAAAESQEAQKVIDAAAAEEGAVKTESGMVLKELTPGQGPSPAATDTVKVHYSGTLRDGTVFDSSYDRGEPATFQLNRVIPCWTEGVQKMKVGGKAKLTCPAELAYGERGAPPKIGPGAALSFEVELLEIVKE